MEGKVMCGKIECVFEQSIYGILICVSVFLIAVSVLEPWVYHDTNGYLTVFLAAVFAVAFGCMLCGIRKLPDSVLCRSIWVGIVVSLLIQLYIVFHMQLIPKVDLSHIYKQCVKMLETGSAQITNTKYFGFNTNNIPITILLYWVFRFSDSLGFSNYRLAGGIFNVLLLFVSYVLIFLMLKKNTSMRAAAAVMLLVLANPAFYAYAPYYYTDTVSLAFTISCTYLILCGMGQEVKWKKIVAFVLAGFLMGIAVKIRVTSIFIVIAVVVCLCFRRQWRKLLQCAVPFLCGIVLFLMLWNKIYAYHVNFDTSESSITVEHFLMMGSTGRGTYSADDVKFTKSFDTHEEKAENNRRVYKQRICENGFFGNLRLAVIKQAIVWGIGAHGYSQYTENVKEKTACYDWITGEKSACFRAYMQSFNIVLYIVIMLGLFKARKRDSICMLVLAVYWGGALIFYIFWEAHARHSLSFLPFLTMLSVPLFEDICTWGAEEKPG